MNSVLRFIALAMFLALAISATTGTFSTYVAKVPASASAVAYTNGYVVTLSAAGWIYGDAVTVTSGTPSITWTTLTANTGSSTAIGLTGATCAAANAVTATSATTLLGRAVAGSASCPSDFATLYIGTSTGTTTTLPASVTSSPLVVNQAVSWTLTQPASTASNVVGIAVNNAGAVPFSTSGASSTSSTAAQQYAVATLSYAFYVETAGTATVCFQTDAQHTSNTSCGTVITTSSAGILSATISGFVAMIALIFFN